MGYEVLTAFFLEAGFLGIMLFGMERVGRALHLFATFVVAVGTLTSAFWILSVNSWMQTPRGYTIGPDGRFLPADWAAIIFNPSFFVRLPHMVLASYLVGRVLRRRSRRLAPAARPWQRGGADDVLDGDVDGGDRGPGADPDGRRARAEHAAVPAGQDRGHGRRLEFGARRAGTAVRHS